MVIVVKQEDNIMKLILTEEAKQIHVSNPSIFLPVQGTEASAGYDIRACIARPITILAGECIKIPLGFRCHIDNVEHAGLLLPRSGLGALHGIVLGNLVGLIDSDYQNEWQCAVWNRNYGDSITIRSLDKIAQVIFIPVVHPRFELVDDFFNATTRIVGFGSTGVNNVAN